MGMFAPDVLAAMVGGVLPPAPKDYHLPTKFPSFDRAYRVAIDLEAHDPFLNEKGPGYRRGDAYIVGISVALQDRDGSIPFAEYYPVGHRGGPNLDAARFFDWLCTELAFYQGEVVGTNLLYDADGLQYSDVVAPMAKWRDVQWAEALIDENAPSYKLGTLAKKYLGEHKVTDELKALYGPGYIKRFREIHPGHARSYGLGDVRLPLRILLKQEEVLKKEKLVELYDIESRLLPMLIYMRKLGMRVDLKQAANLGTMFIEKRDENLAAASKLCGIHLTADNYSKPGTQDIIFSNLGITLPRLMADGDDPKKPLTWTGKPTVKKTWLENTLEHPIGDLLAAAGAFDKAKGTFLDGYITDCVIGDRIHCELHPLRRIDDGDFGGGVNGTVSGRFSGSNPNLQNIPARDDVIGPLCRSMFIPDEGMDFWSADYCVVPTTRVLTAGLEWKQADSLVVGEELISCDEEPQVGPSGKMKQRFLRRSVVEGLKRLRQPCVRITTDKGTVTCSTRHRWLARNAGGRGGSALYEWTLANSLKVGQSIGFITAPWEADTSRDGGYLAGLFDGEGTLGWGSCSFAQKPAGDNVLVLEKGEHLLKERDFVVTRNVGKKTIAIRINGGREELLRFLGSIRPARLLAKSAKVWEGHALRSRSTTPACILAVEQVGEQEVIAVQTSQRTFIAEGFVSHNSQIEFRLLVHLAVAYAVTGYEVPQRMYRENPKTDFHVMVADLTKLPRKKAKGINFGLAFCMGEAKLAGQVGLVNPVTLEPLPEAKVMLDQYHAQVPFVRAVSRAATDWARKHSYIATLLGRRSRFELFEPRNWVRGQKRPVALPEEQAKAAYGEKNLVRALTHKALNRFTQGSAADIIKVAMVRAWEAGIFSEGTGLRLSLQVHDELDGSVERSARGKETLRALKDIMVNAIALHVPVLVETATGANWAETH